MKKITLLFITMGIWSATYAQLDFSKLTNDVLLEKGKDLYLKKDFANASIYLYCYYQKNFDAITRGNSTIRECLVFADQSNRDYRSDCRRCKIDLSTCQNSGAQASGLEDSGPALVSPSPPTSYPLVLSGGENIRYTIVSNKALGGMQIQIMGYEKAALGYEANNNNLEEGKAAWLDRPINPDEPNIIIIPISDENFTINIVNGLPVYGGHLAMLNYIKMPDRKFRLQLYNDGQGNFIVTAPLPRYKTQKGN